MSIDAPRRYSRNTPDPKDQKLSKPPVATRKKMYQGGRKSQSSFKVFTANRSQANSLISEKGSKEREEAKTPTYISSLLQKNSARFGKNSSDMMDGNSSIRKPDNSEMTFEITNKEKRKHFKKKGGFRSINIDNNSKHRNTVMVQSPNDFGDVIVHSKTNEIPSVPI